MKEQSKETKKRNNDEGPARLSLDDAKKRLTASLDTIARKESELEDSRQFVNEIEARLKSLDDSERTRGYFGSLAIQFLPLLLS